MKVQRCDRQYQIAHPFRLQRRVGEGKHAAFTDAEKIHLVGPGAIQSRGDTVVDVAGDVVVDTEPAVGPGRTAPVDDPRIDAQAQQVADQ
jgi:hypothetical protein